MASSRSQGGEAADAIVAFEGADGLLARRVHVSLLFAPGERGRGEGVPCGRALQKRIAPRRSGGDRRQQAVRVREVRDRLEAVRVAHLKHTHIVDDLVEHPARLVRLALGPQQLAPHQLGERRAQLIVILRRRIGFVTVENFLQGASRFAEPVQRYQRTADRL